MLYVILTIMFTLVIISRLVVSDKLSKMIILIYLLWWTVWLGLSTFDLYELFSVSNSTYYLLLLNVTLFCAGFLFCGAFRDKNENKNKNEIQYINLKVSKHSWVLKLLIIVVFILLYYWIRYRNVVLSMTSLNIRMERFTIGNLFSSTPEILFFNYFIESFMYAAVIVLAYMVIYGQFKSITFILLALSMFLYAGIGSGRGPIIDILVAMVLIYFIRRINSEKKMHLSHLSNKMDKTKKMKLWNMILIAFVILTIFVYSAWLTASRLGYTEFNMESIQIGWNEFFKQGVLYSTGPFRALDYGLKAYPENLGYLFGRGTFAGIDEIINLIFKIIGISYTSANGIIGDVLQNNQILIGYNQAFNFAYTSVMIHYFDLGILGVIIFPFIFGFFMRKSIYLYEKEPALPTLIIMAFLFNTMINSDFKWGLQSPSSNIVLIGCYFWYKYKYKNKAEENKDILLS